MIKKIIKKFVPRAIFLFYHRSLAVLAASFYGWPSKKMIIIGVTGTGGKSTVVNLIGRILEEAGYRVGWTTTVNFKVAEKEWLNKTKMTMLGRFALQKILRQMVKAGCRYAIIETSSEGIVQSRHLGIDYDVAVFTNLSPEHIESHGSFENYRRAKGRLFAKLKNKKGKAKIINGQKVKKISVVNLDDQAADYFLQFPADEHIGYKIKNQKSKSKIINQNLKIIEADNLKLTLDRSEFIMRNALFQLQIAGEFNVYNALAAIAVALSQNIDLAVCQRALAGFRSVPGRMETVINQPFKVIVDYAHTPDSLEKVYQLISSIKYPESKIIALLGAAGGGRDKWKRPKLGEIAARYGQEIIITNEDPYDEDPQKIIEEVAMGVQGVNLYKILDRREAIKKALELARSDDLVIITGKGAEPLMCVADGKKIPWDDREVVKEEMVRLKS